MYRYQQEPRPHASFACRACREVTVVEPGDLPEASTGILPVPCAVCQRPQPVQLHYMRQQLVRDGR